MCRLLFYHVLTIVLLNITSICYTANQQDSLPEGPKVNVLLVKETRSALLEVKGGYRVICKDRQSVLSSGSLGKRYVVHAIQEGLRWGEEYPDIYHISVIPTHPHTAIYVNGIQYKGTISVYHTRRNCITVINEVPIEDYLKSTLAVQYAQPIHQEAMRALVIAARTEVYGIVNQKKPHNRPWEVSAQEVGYYGYGVTHQQNGVDAAVDWTRYMIVKLAQNASTVDVRNRKAFQAEELANKGYDAKTILHTMFPHQKLGITIDSDAIAFFKSL